MEHPFTINKHVLRTQSVCCEWVKMASYEEAIIFCEPAELYGITTVGTKVGFGDIEGVQSSLFAVIVMLSFLNQIEGKDAGFISQSKQNGSV